TAHKSKEQTSPTNIAHLAALWVLVLLCTWCAHRTPQAIAEDNATWLATAPVAAKNSPYILGICSCASCMGMYTKYFRTGIASQFVCMQLMGTERCSPKEQFKPCEVETLKRYCLILFEVRAHLREMEREANQE